MPIARTERNVIAFLAFLGILLAFGVDVALPAFDEIEAEFDLADGGPNISLVITAYFFGMAAGQLVHGPMSDRFGRAPVLRAGLLLYALAALGAALAPSFELLLVARFVWGLASAAPFLLRGAIARDLYEGDRMARIVTLMMAVFLIGPMIVPFVGEGLLAVSSWPWVFATGVLLASAGIAWSLLFGETLDPANRRPLTLRPMLGAARVVVRTRVTVGHIAVQTLGSAAFLIFLGSAAPIIDDVYDRDSQFAMWFALSGLASVGALLVNNRAIARFGAATMLSVVLRLQVLASAVGLAMMLAADGRPAFGWWFVWVTVVNALFTLATPMANALALGPMGALAGTASALMGFCSLAGGAALAAIFDARIDTTVTPMAVGYVLFGSLALIAAWWARPTVDRGAASSSGAGSAASDDAPSAVST